jgi:hypothetical protein
MSPWGSDYDSAEWVITDLRGSIALRMAGDAARADALLEWVRAQAAKNYWMVAETFDEVAGTYKFNSPMLGFGAGAYALALAHRAGAFADPACGAYFDEGAGETTGDPTGGDTSAGTTGDPTTGSQATSTDGETTSGDTTGATTTTSTSGDPATAGLTDGRGDDGGCGCASGGGGPWWLLVPLFARRRRCT